MRVQSDTASSLWGPWGLHRSSTEPFRPHRLRVLALNMGSHALFIYLFFPKANGSKLGIYVGSQWASTELERDPCRVHAGAAPVRPIPLHSETKLRLWYQFILTATWCGTWQAHTCSQSPDAKPGGNTGSNGPGPKPGRLWLENELALSLGTTGVKSDPTQSSGGLDRG